LTLEGESLERYVARLTALIDAARLNKLFPDPRRVNAVYRAMRPSQGRITVDPRSGLPSEKDVSRVFTDAQLAAQAVQEPAVGDSAAARRHRERHDYYESLRRDPPGEPVSLSLSLRRVDDTQQKAHFTVVFDRFDLAEAVFVRYTIQLAQKSSRWTRQQVELIGDDLSYTRNFRNVISRFTSDEAEFAFLLLSDLPNIEVEDVVRGRVGPLYVESASVPAEYQPLVRDGAAVLHLPMDRAGKSVPRDGSGDPLTLLYRDFLRRTGGAEAADPIDARAKSLGYHVWKERKLCCTPEVVEPLQRLLRKRCVVRTLAEARA